MRWLRILRWLCSLTRFPWGQYGEECDIWTPHRAERSSQILLDGEWQPVVRKNSMHQDMDYGESGVVLSQHGNHEFGVPVEEGDYEAVPVVGC